MTFFGFCKTQLSDPASRDLWWHQHGPGFYEKKRKIIVKTWALHEMKVHIKKKEKVHEF